MADAQLELLPLIAYYESFRKDARYMFLDVSSQVLLDYTIKCLTELNEIKGK